MQTPKTVLFVCEHGALRSRIAAAYFNAAPAPGWRARSAGREPQAEVSPVLETLLTGTAALDVLERDAPRTVSADAARTIAIDCDEPADETWVLQHREADAGMRDEIHHRVAALAADLNVVTRQR
ncbi:MAG: hypothetical protein M3O80_02120 [Chloroflexota bacterium]|nr:hypothetical protein [Chloroflexota bacterium]